MLRVNCQILQIRKVFCQTLKYLSLRLLRIHLLTHRVFICLSVCLLCVSEPNEGSGRQQKMDIFAVERENQEHASVLLLRVWVSLKFHLLPLLEAQKRKKGNANTTRKSCDNHLSTV